jgi:hypothetical protein
MTLRHFAIVWTSVGSLNAFKGFKKDFNFSRAIALRLIRSVS